MISRGGDPTKNGWPERSRRRGGRIGDGLDADLGGGGGGSGGAYLFGHY